MLYILTPRAQRHLRTILNDIEEYSGEGRRLATEQSLLSAFAAIAANPGIGHLRKDIVPAELYFHSARPYAVIYRRFELPTQIIVIIHGARDLSVLLQNESD
jgi:plasmid stabilization system protein ParE